MSSLPLLPNGVLEYLKVIRIKLKKHIIRIISTLTMIKTSMFKVITFAQSKSRACIFV